MKIKILKYYFLCELWLCVFERRGMQGVKDPKENRKGPLADSAEQVTHSPCRQNCINAGAHSFLLTQTLKFSWLKACICAVTGHFTISTCRSQCNPKQWLL